MPENRWDDTAIDFRRIPLGDIDLRQEIRLEDRTGLVRRRSGRRRMYSANIHGVTSEMTVYLYEGDNTEEVCFPRFLLQSYLHFILRNGGKIYQDILGFGTGDLSPLIID
jgi:hypothetical protein